MTKRKKSFCFFLCLLIGLFGFSTTTEAAVSGITPYYDYTMFTSSGLNITSSGRADVSIVCSGMSNCTKISAETCLQRKVGIIWVKVNIGVSGNIWTSSTTSQDLAKTYSAMLSKSGTYRAKTIFTVYSGSKSEKITLYSGTDTY
ncbi:MAG: hypothetical protein ACLUFN_09155 [Eubacterium sp.]